MEIEETLEIPSIVDSISQNEIDEFQPVHERYYEAKFFTKFSTPEKNVDTCIRIHTNKMCVVYLSPQHSILTKGEKLVKINFQVNKINRLINIMKGKGKRGAQILAPDSILCYLESENDKYPVYAGVHGKLLEINEELIENPNIILEDILSDGFIALILPDLKKREECLAELVNREEYECKKTET